MVHNYKFPLFYLAHWNCTLFFIIIYAVILMELGETLFGRDTDFSPEIISSLACLLILLVEGRLGTLGCTTGTLLLIFFIRVEGFSALVRLNTAFFVTLNLLHLFLDVLLHLTLVHVFDFFNYEIWNWGRRSIRIVVIIDIYVVIVYYLNYLRRIALSHVP